MLSTFVEDLFRGRPLRLGPPAVPDEADLQQTLESIATFEEQSRLELPGEPPEYNPEAAGWAAVKLYLASSLVIYRDVNPEEIGQLLASPPPDRASCETHYSVDLTMRFLPSLMQFAKAASSDDPLVKRLGEFAREWPLSSVGMKDVGAVDITSLRTSETLMRLYVDRIIHTQDSSRLIDPTVQEAVTAALGAYETLSPDIVDALSDLQTS